MTTNELRIGNWIQASTYLQVDARFIYEYDKVGGDYKPIPLTEEWLMKFGYFSAFTKIIGKIQFNIIYSSCCEIEIERTCFRVDYVHEFQNWYFMLTGQELTIKNP